MAYATGGTLPAVTATGGVVFLSAAEHPEDNQQKQDTPDPMHQEEDFSVENVFKDADIGPDPYRVEQPEKGETPPSFVDNAPLFQDEQQPQEEEEELRLHTPQEKKKKLPPHKKLFQDREATRQISLEEIDKVQARSDAMKKRKHIKSSKKKLRNGIIYTVFVVGFSIVLSIVMIYAIYDIFGFNKAEGQVVVSVERDTSISKLSKLLKENGIINQPGIFQLYAGLKDVEPYNAGEYTLNKNMSYDQIIYSMQSQSKEYNTVMVTITEGQSLVEISQILEENGVCSANEFIEALQTRSFGFDFEDQIPTDTGIYFPYEGYLFPDTYEFFIDENVDSVIKKFFVNFDAKITDEMKARMEELGMTLHETLTLASIIQKEAGSNEEMKRDFDEKVEKYNLQNDEVKPQNPKTIKKFEKQHLLTDTGIEITIPMEEYNNKDRVQFITNPDGTISILIQNIGELISK